MIASFIELFFRYYLRRNALFKLLSSNQIDYLKKMSEAIEFAKFFVEKYKIKFEQDDIDFLYQQFLDQKSSIDRDEGHGRNDQCPFDVKSKNAICGIKLKEGQSYCLRHTKVLANRQKVTTKPNASTRKKKSIDQVDLEKYLVDSKGLVTHRKNADGTLQPLNQEDIDFCESKGFKFREPEIEDFFEDSQPDDITNLENQVSNICIGRKN